jgi:transcriptional regulator GlxA family with amidase domain
LTRRRLLLVGGAAALTVAGVRVHEGERRRDSVDTIGIAVWDGVEELDFAGPYEVLTAWAAYRGNGMRVVTVAESDDTVRCAHGLKVVPDTTWKQVGNLDVFLLPGGNSTVQMNNEAFLERVRRLAASGTLMTSVCTGALVYGAAGLLDGRPATTHWQSLDMLATYGADVRRDDRFVDDGNLVTSAGVSAGIDMALHLVARLDSPERARDVKRYIQYDPKPPV